jgi:S1-C subfamily serine protease
MIRDFAVAVSALVALHLGAYALHGRFHCDKSEVDLDGGPCLEESHPVDESASVDDRILRDHLVQEGESLIARDAVPDMKELLKQLEQNSCHVALSPSKRLCDAPTELYAKAKNSVVVVGSLYKCEKCTKWHATMATGFVIASSGAVVTTYHAVNNPTRRAIVVMTGDQRVFPVDKILAASRSDDLAILHVDAKDLAPLPIADSAAAAPVGSPVRVISHPAGQFFYCTSGIIARYTKVRSADKKPVSAVAITADYARGSSGAPVLNEQGQVVAIVKATDSIYYTQTPQEQKNLQMVVKTCIPSASLLKLIAP